MTEGGLRVAVVSGGPSAEADVSRATAAGVREALGARGHRADALDLDSGLATQLATGDYDVVFPAVHGPLGEDGCLQGLLDVVGLPYVGSGVLASALAANKVVAKVLFRVAGLPVAEDMVVRASEDVTARAKEVPGVLGRAVVVKPAGGGSAIGVTRIEDSRDQGLLVAALDRALALDERVLVERMSPGREVTCAVLEDDSGVARALSPTLVLPRAASWYDFESRYAPGGSEHVCPAPFAAPLLDLIQSIARRAHESLEARDLSRVDFVVDDERSTVTLLEVNTLPGMTPTSLFPEAAAEAGIDFPTLCDRLVRRAHARPPRRAPPAVPMPPAHS